MLFVNIKNGMLGEFNEKNMEFVAYGHVNSLNTEDWYRLPHVKLNFNKVEKVDLIDTDKGRMLVVEEEDITRKIMVSVDTLAMQMGHPPDDWMDVGEVNEDVDKMLKGTENVQILHDKIILLDAVCVSEWYLSLNTANKQFRVRKWTGGWNGYWYASENTNWMKIEGEDGTTRFIYAAEIDSRVASLDRLFNVDKMELNDLDYFIEIALKSGGKEWYIGLTLRDGSYMINSFYSWDGTQVLEKKLLHEQPDMWLGMSNYALKLLDIGNKYIQGNGYIGKLKENMAVIGFESEDGRNIASARITDKPTFLSVVGD
jgi:hypothetical protein